MRTATTAVLYTVQAVSYLIIHCAAPHIALYNVCKLIMIDNLSKVVNYFFSYSLYFLVNKSKKILLFAMLDVDVI